MTGFVTAYYGQRMTVTWRALYGRVAAFNTRIEANVGGIRVVQAFANEDHERNLFAAANGNYRTTKLEAYRFMAAEASLNSFSMRFVQVSVFLVGAWFVTTGAMSAGGFGGP